MTLVFDGGSQSPLGSGGQVPYRLSGVRGGSDRSGRGVEVATREVGVGWVGFQDGSVLGRARGRYRTLD